MNNDKLVTLKQNVIERIKDDLEYAEKQMINENLHREERQRYEQKVTDYKYFIGVIEQEIEYLK